MTDRQLSGIDQIKAAGERERRTVDALREETLVPVTGIVSPGSIGAGRLLDDDFWTFRFALACWRLNGGDIQDRKLHLRKLVAEDEREALFRQLEPYALVGMEARVSETTNLDGVQGLLEHLASHAPTDAGLAACAKRLQEPAEFEHPVLGVFLLNRELDWHVAKIQWGTHSIELVLDCASPHGLENAAATAVSLWRDQTDWDRKSVAFAVQNLLGLKNASWLGDGEAELNAADFAARLELENVTVSEDGAFHFWYADGDMFLGHSIHVTGNLTDGLTEVEIAG